MANFRTGLIAGAAITIAAFLAPALAHAHDGKRADANMMTIVDANGSVTEARNTTPVAPRGAGAVIAPSPFALMDRMAAQMNAQMNAQINAMMRQAQVAQTSSGSQTVAAGAAPPGVCMQSVEVTQVPGHEPQVVRRQAGNCGAPNAAARSAAPQHHAPAPAPARQAAPRDSI